MGIVTRSPDYTDCHGCSLCLLSCPMWQQKRDVKFSPQGFAKAMQSGATAEDIQAELASCIMCGACDVLCPENIDLTGMVNEAWQEVGFNNDNKQADTADYFAISCDPILQQRLTPGDLYIINAQALHVDYDHRIGHYEALRRGTGCQINLDLHRIVIPTGYGSMAANTDHFDVKKQLEWLLQGRTFDRVVVENPADKQILAETTGKPVLSLTELLGWAETEGEEYVE